MLVHQAPLRIYKTWQAGKYPKVSPADFAAYYSQYRSIRLGAYGDPAAVPLDVIDEIMDAKWCGHTGYTHQWQWCDIRYKKYLMASVENLEEKDFANALGYRTFRVLNTSDSPSQDEINCPASIEAGKTTTCERCRLCAGAYEGRRVKNISIHAHGIRAKSFNKKQEAACASST